MPRRGAKSRVPVPGGGMVLQIFLVQKLQCDARLAQLDMEIGAIRHGALASRQRGTPIEPGLQHVIGQHLQLRPV
jgi:hypothetical protein